MQHIGQGEEEASSPYFPPKRDSTFHTHDLEEENILGVCGIGRKATALKHFVCSVGFLQRKLKSSLDRFPSLVFDHIDSLQTKQITLLLVSHHYTTRLCKL